MSDSKEKFWLDFYETIYDSLCGFTIIMALGEGNKKLKNSKQVLYSSYRKSELVLVFCVMPSYRFLLRTPHLKNPLSHKLSGFSLFVHVLTEEGFYVAMESVQILGWALFRKAASTRHHINHGCRDPPYVPNSKFSTNLGCHRGL